jgi:hypothetical protein
MTMHALYEKIASLDFGLWLLVAIMLFMAVGSFLTGEASGINDVALLTWLREVPLGLSWWLWTIIALLALLVINTLLCSVEAIRLRFARMKLVNLLAPQLIHLGFLFVVLAHLLSAQGGAKEGGQVQQGMTVTLPDSSQLRFDAISGQIGPMGMPTDYQAAITHVTATGTRKTVISPNHPYFHGGYGIYLKHAELGPQPFGIVEMHREPGAGLAGAGALIFTIGNISLLVLRRGATA